ncbi:CLUMA_CG013941, isoform A [Clunio marinus]|uniref:CLUMA_CG013941, isoform A n=1 Tax=Clunio marinus TaxID=568069 RepID=A0A1J1IQA3_9DIPT|nr:CLUMA_CG013941, isoform A [Clunio marinus]
MKTRPVRIETFKTNDFSLNLKTENSLPQPNKNIWTGRVIGGSTAVKGQFPYLVSFRSGIMQSHFCGGFIITEHWIGTAGHCASGKWTWNTYAIVGATVKANEGIKHSISKFVIHPDYDKTSLINDISLVRTVKKIKFIPTVQPIKLSSHPVPDGSNAIALGWGYTTYPGQASQSLQYIRVKTISRDNCRKRMTLPNSAKLFESSLCAESASGSGGACMGDSGGPLVANNLIIGIVSWGIPCSKGFPDVYTRVASHKAWIDSVINWKE